MWIVGFISKWCVLCLFLNVIFFIIFVLKSLLFRPHFVEYRRETISIDKNPKAYGQGREATHNWTYRLKKFFQRDRHELEFYLMPNAVKLKLEEKQFSGTMGTLYKLDGRSALVQRSPVELICKLINLDRLRTIVCKVNGLPISEEEQHHVQQQPQQQPQLANGFNRLNAEMLKRYTNHMTKCNELSEANKQRVIHPNIVYMKHMFVHHKNNTMATTAGDNQLLKVLKEVTSLQDVRNNAQLPSLLLVVMPMAKYNLRLLMLYEWTQFTLKTTAEFAKQIGRGLEYLHVHLDMAHLNLKPENIIAFETEDIMSTNLHDRYVLKLSDIGTISLLPSTSSVLSSSHNSSIYCLSPPFVTANLNGTADDQLYHDLHCYALTVLLMMVGYEQFSNCFMLAPFPFGIIASPKSKLLKIIADHDKRMIPETFCQLFSLMLGTEKPEKTIFKQIVDHPALTNAH